MKKKSKSILALSIAQWVLGFIMGAFFSFSVADLVVDKTEIRSKYFLIIVLIVFVVFMIIYGFTFFVSKGFFSRHWVSVLIMWMLSICAISSMNVKTEFNQQKIENMISIEWMIYGITVACYVLYSTIRLSKSNKFISDPNELIGNKRLDKISEIMATVSEHKSMMFSITILIFNVLFLSATTGMIYISSISSQWAKFLLIMSFYICTNSLIVLIVESISPMIKLKIEFDKKIENYNLNVDGDALMEMAVEDLLFEKYYQMVFNQDDNEMTKKEKEKVINDFIIENRDKMPALIAEIKNDLRNKKTKKHKGDSLK